MTVRQNSAYTPSAGRGLQQGLDNLGSLFTPASAQEIYLGHKAKTEQAAAVSRANALTKLRAGQPLTLPDMFDLGVADPIKAQQAVDAQSSDPVVRERAIEAIHGYAGSAPSQKQAEDAKAYEQAHSNLSSGQMRPADPAHGQLSDLYAPVDVAPGHAVVRGDLTRITNDAPDKSSPSGAAGAILSGMKPEDFEHPTPAQQWAMKQGGGQNINVNTNPSTTVQDKVNGAAGDDVTETIKAGEAAQNKLVLINRMKNAIADAGDGLTWGPGSDASIAFKKAAASLFGAAPEETQKLGDAAIVQYYGQQLVSAAAKDLSPRVTQQEVAMIQAVKPGFANSKAGTLAILGDLEQDAHKDIQLGALARDPANYGNWFAAKQAYEAANPIVPTLSTGDKPTAPAASPYANATADDLAKLDPKTMTPEQLQAASDRHAALTAGAPPAPVAATAAPAPAPVAAPASAPALPPANFGALVAPMALSGAAPSPTATASADPAPIAAPVPLTPGAPVLPTGATAPIGSAPVTPIPTGEEADAPETPAPLVTGPQVSAAGPIAAPMPMAPIAPMPLPGGPASMQTPFMTNLMASLNIGGR